MEGERSKDGARQRTIYIKKDGCALVMIYAGRLCLYDFYDLIFFCNNELVAMNE